LSSYSLISISQRMYIEHRIDRIVVSASVIVYAQGTQRASKGR
jgi:hypothetical protein